MESIKETENYVFRRFYYETDDFYEPFLRSFRVM